jgi:hypothetical protein
MSLEIIRHNDIPLVDCLLISTRDYTIPAEDKPLECNYLFFKGGWNDKRYRMFSGLKIWKTIENRNNFDKLIFDNTQGDKYQCFLGSCADDLANLLVTHKNCTGYYIYEEGMASYNPHIPPIFSGLRHLIFKCFLKPFFPRFYSIKEYNIYPFYYKFKKFIAISQRCFPTHNESEKLIINNPFKPIKLDFVTDAIVSIDALLLFIGKESAHEVYLQLLKYISSQNYKKIAYKFHPWFYIHPEEKKEYQQLITTVLGNNAIELHENIILERVLTTYKCDFYTGYCSSVCIYGAFAGAKCYLATPLLKKYNISFDNLPLKDMLYDIDI